MKNIDKKILLFTLVAALLAFSFFKFGKNGGEEKDNIIKQAVFATAIQVHYNELKIDDSFSEKVFDLYIKRLDQSKQFLLASDVTTLSKYKTRIDDEAMGKPNPLLDEAVALITERTKDVKGYYTEILSNPFDFNKKETIETDNKKKGRLPDTAALKDYWRKQLKYDALNRLVTKQKAQKKAQEKAQKEGKSFEFKTNAELEIEIRKTMLKNYNRWFDRMLKQTGEDRLAQYINAILSIYGPHTSYFPPQKKENFDIAMSGKLEGIGAQLQEIDGAIKVYKIVPGSASWKQKELKKEDIILKVGQAEEEPVDVTNMSLNEAIKMIRGKKDTEVRLTVKKPDGSIKIIPIVRDVVVLEATYAKSTVLENKETGKKFGYILLPSFYADFNAKKGEGRNSADDVKKEVEKLKAQNVDGIMIDLRNNGGGSLTDAIKMAGLFIKKGPVVQVRGRRNQQKAYKDNDADVTYDGPLVVMVHKFSASASEIFSAALQDHNRAVIIGSPSSYGKGTVQRFLDLDRLVSSKFQEIKPLGAVKLTFQKFYRINGQAMQNKGVIPDIILPNTYNYLEVGEKFRDYAFSFDTIPALDYQKWQVPKYASETIVKASNIRVNKNHTFKNIESHSKKLKKRKDHSEKSLNLHSHLALQKKLDKENEKHSVINPDSLIFNFIPVNVYDPKDKLDAIKIKTRNDWFSQVKKDLYIQEATNVLNDLGKEKKK